MTILPLFLFLLAFGLLAVLPAAPAKAVGSGYWKLISLIAAALLVFATRFAFDRDLLSLYRDRHGAQGFWKGVECLGVAGCLVGTLGVLGLASAGRERVAGLVLGLALASGAVGLTAQGIGFGRNFGFSAALTTATVGGLLLSSLVLGSVLGGMLLGHWYLVRPGLSFRYLELMTGLIIAALVLRLALSTAVGVSCLGAGLAYNGSELQDLLERDPVPLLARAAFGFVGPLVLAVMTWQTVKLKANQPATGLLYACVVVVLAGELVGTYVLAARHLPL
ncbi:MAG: hypothetical protein HYZ53_06305 [Planctomycetes bacterium]|nr:hypothetical protein [Planctomycetota bacterium]